MINLTNNNLLPKPIRALLLLSAFCSLMIIINYLRTSNITYFFLGWNLLLAWIPLVIAHVWHMKAQRKQTLIVWKSVIYFGLWLLFFPNSPYIITDLIHLNNRYTPSLWSDVLLIFSCAFAGLIVGVYSLIKIQKILSLYFNKLTNMLIVSASLIMTGFGIYLGRIKRWNSWDLFTNPVALISDSFDQLFNPQAIRMTLGFSLLLFIVYYILQSIISHESSQK